MIIRSIRSELDKAELFLIDPVYRFNVLRSHGLCKHMPDEEYLKRLFKIKVGKNLDLENPVTFNEKLQWLKLHDRNPLYPILVDKYAVKGWVSERIGSEHVIPTYGVWKRFSHIEFDALPERFVLKCTHDSGGLVICSNRSEFDYHSARRIIERSLRRNYYWVAREWPYKEVAPRVIAEEYIQSDCDCESIYDYKVLCFAGVPKLIELHKGRFVNHTQDWYDTSWNRLAIQQPNIPISSNEDTAPLFLEEMLELSAKLSNGLPHVRVDWYHSGEKLLFGEMTLYDGAGLEPFLNEDDDIMIGNMINLDIL